MSVKLTPELEQFVEACDGVASVGGEHQSYVVMSAERFRGCFESDEDHDATMEAIRRGWDDMLNGRTTPMEVLFQEFDNNRKLWPKDTFESL